MPKRPPHPGRRRDQRQSSQPSSASSSTSSPAQPGLPSGSARLLAVRREGETVRLEVAGGAVYEVAASALPPDLPPPGGELDPEQHRAVALAAERKRAARRLFGLLDRRLQPVARLRGKLLDEGHLPEAVEAVLEAMHAQGVHSDRRYAEAWCRDCLLSRTVGRRYLESKLRGAGIAPDLARQAAADALGGGLEEELAAAAAVSCWRRFPRAEPRDQARVVRFLMGRGFDPALAGRAARQTRPKPGGDGADPTSAGGRGAFEPDDADD